MGGDKSDDDSDSFRCEWCIASPILCSNCPGEGVDTIECDYCDGTFHLQCLHAWQVGRREQGLQIPTTDDRTCPRHHPQFPERMTCSYAKAHTSVDGENYANKDLCLFNHGTEDDWCTCKVGGYYGSCPHILYPCSTFKCSGETHACCQQAAEQGAQFSQSQIYCIECHPDPQIRTQLPVKSVADSLLGQSSTSSEVTDNIADGPKLILGRFQHQQVCLLYFCLHTHHV